jgi:hypothetical protein
MPFNLLHIWMEPVAGGVGYWQRMVLVQQGKRLRVDLDELCYALDDSSFERSYYLDLETGELLFVSDYMGTEEAEKLKQQLNENPDRYECLPKADSYVGYQDMEDFVATVEDEHLAHSLEVALNGKGAFRRFKDVLARYPAERERWYRFKADRLKQRSLEWLEDIGVEPI